MEHEKEMNELMDLVTRNSSRIFALETLIEKLNAEEFLRMEYRLRHYEKVCRVALSHPDTTGIISNIDIRGAELRRVIRKVAESVDPDGDRDGIAAELCREINAWNLRQEQEDPSADEEEFPSFAPPPEVEASDLLFFPEEWELPEESSPDDDGDEEPGL